MTSPPTGEWPTDPDGLASIAADPGQRSDDRDRAFRELMPTIRRIARRVAGRFSVPYGDDLLEEAAGEVWPALPGFRVGGSFEAWCYGVLRNHLIDRFRNEQRERTHRAHLAAVGEA